MKPAQTVTTMGNNSLVEKAIREYVISDGWTLPYDWEDHVVGGQLEDACVFCKSDKRIEHYIMPTLDKFQIGCSIPIPVCPTCWNKATDTASPSWWQNQDVLSAGGAQGWYSVIQDEIVPYILHSKFPDDFEEADLEGTFELCNFCGNECGHIYSHFAFSKVDEVLHSHKYYRPVRKNVGMIEPPVTACIRCNHAVEYLTHRLAKDVRSNQDIVMANCFKCDSAYAIEVAELEARQETAMSAPLNQYLCPKCAGEFWEGLSRWTFVPCHDCRTENSYDRMHNFFYEENYTCKCKKNSKSKKDNVETVTFLVENSKGKEFHIALLIVEEECGGIKKKIITVTDTDASDAGVIDGIGTYYANCTRTAEGSCGCYNPNTDWKQFVTKLIIELLEKLETYDST